MMEAETPKDPVTFRLSVRHSVQQVGAAGLEPATFCSQSPSPARNIPAPHAQVECFFPMIRASCVPIIAPTLWTPKS